jgi:hypothetical protein
MLTHVHKVIHMVVSTFEQGLRSWRSRGSVSCWETLIGRWSRSDWTLTLMFDQCWLAACRWCWSDQTLGASGRLQLDTSGHKNHTVNPLWKWPDATLSSAWCSTSARQVITLTALLTNSWPLKSNAWDLNRDTWRPSASLACINRTLQLHPVNPTSASGRPEVGTLLSLTSLFFRDAYK